jgi:hypothetical protein
MTREQQIEAALKLSKLPPARRAAARVSIEKTLGVMGSARILHGLIKLNRSKAGRTYHLAFRKFLIAHKALLAIGSELLVSDLPIAAFEAGDKLVQDEFFSDFVDRGPQGFAAALAYELLLQWWGSDEFISTTRKGPWWRLSAILYGRRDADLFRHLCKFKPERSPFRPNQTRTTRK